MKTTRKRILPALLCAALLFGALATPVYADGPVQVGDLPALLSAIEAGQTAELTADITIDTPQTLQGADIAAGPYRLIVKADVTMNDVSITAQSPAGKAPICIAADDVTFLADGLTVTQQSTVTGAGFASCAQAFQIANEDATDTPDRLDIQLKDSVLTTSSLNSRGIVFLGSSDHTKLVLDNTKVQCGAEDQWSGERGIALFNQCDIDIDILNGSIISGYKYGINAGHDTGVPSERIDVLVDASTIIGWGTFNIWSSDGTFTVQNGSLLRGINGSFNNDKVFGFNTVVINDNIYNNPGWGTALENTVIIEDSTVEAITRDGQPIQDLIRFDNAQNTLLALRGDTVLRLDPGTSEVDWPAALYNYYMADQADMETFITQNVEVEDTVTIEGLPLFAVSLLNDKSDLATMYVKATVASADETMGTVTSNLDPVRLTAIGSTIDVTATPADGYVFTGWYDQWGTLLSSDAQATLTIDESITDNEALTGRYEITATFAVVDDSGNVKIPSAPSAEGAQDNAQTEAGQQAVEEVKDDIATNEAVSSFVPVFGGAVSTDGLDGVDAGDTVYLTVDVDTTQIQVDESGDVPAVTSIVYDVSVLYSTDPDDPASFHELPNERLGGKAVTFRLPIPASVTTTYARVQHDGDADRYLTIEKTAQGQQYIQLSATHFSPYTVTFTNTKPSTPSEPAGSDEPERDEGYAYWMQVRERIEDAEPGDTVKANAGSYDELPYLVMQALRQKKDVTLHITWDGGKDIIIPSACALGEEPGRIFYPLASLEEMDFSCSGQPSGGTEQNPETGSIIQTPGTGTAVTPDPAPTVPAPIEPTPIEPIAPTEPDTGAVAPGITPQSPEPAQPQASLILAFVLSAAAVLVAAGAGLWLYRRSKRS